MARFTALLALAVVLPAINAYNISAVASRFARDVEGTEDETAVGEARYGGSTAVSAITGYEYIAYIGKCDKSGSNAIGLGVIVNQYWIATVGDLANTVKNDASACVFDSTADFATPGGKHRIKGGKTATGYASGTLGNDFGILRVCPSFATSMVLPSAKTPTATDVYTIGNAVDMFSYSANKLSKASKKVGEKCECEAITGFNTPADTMTCLAEDPLATTIGASGEGGQGLIAVETSSNKVIGFLIKEQDAANGGGEVVINLGDYLAFIGTDALPKTPV